MQTNLKPAILWHPKIDQQNSSLPHTYFIEHLMCMTRKPPRKLMRTMENSSLGFSGSRTTPAAREATNTREKNLALTISTGEDIHRAKMLELRAEIEENKLLVRRTSGET
jgi:hypothetical protein